ncbi:MAG TPA: biotin carboxylase N-terminal domain-containing protein [Kofleriaceae bacterium]|nr:biotin carboxylase N-terminal domain-containing protein [Kofleriaceae bacterium]
MKKLLIANRGEIALRVMRTAKSMGIATVAVFSDADEAMPFVRFADEAVRLGPPPARESYLSIEKIIAAAKRVEADAIHPGYGFLSENAAFARAVAEAGLVFVGPSADVIHRLGSKKEAKAIAEAAGVPVVPGYRGDDQSTSTLVERAKEIGFPLLVKASAGGGGKGMRIVREAGELAEAIDRAKGEAASAFGDDTLLLERYVERPRHIEIQILGDQHGALVHLWERECSIQRRHQKVIEESPSPVLDLARRIAMGNAAVAIGRAVGYTNAGTVELITDTTGRDFYFLEVNTRLQVEHPVTELVTGIDLVREQIRVARGEPLAIKEPPPQRGHAIEVRLYAEDADRGYVPATGPVLDFRISDEVRVDSGVERGSEVGIHYDPMLAKVIAHAPTRGEAAALLARALETATVAGLTTNRAFLARVLRHPAFVEGALDTHFLDRHASELAAPARDLRTAAIAATLAAWHARKIARTILPHVEPGWRNVPFADQTATYACEGETITIAYRHLGGGRFAIGDRTIRLISGGDTIVFEDDGLRISRRVVTAGDKSYVDGLVLALEPRFPDASREALAGGLVAPMPARVTKVLVKEGDDVATGATLLVLEAMKMEHAVKAPEGGTVTKLAVAAGDQVQVDQLLAVVTPAGG